MNVIPFEPAHLSRIELGGYDRVVFAGFDIEALAAGWPAGQAFSAADGERVLGAAGILKRGREGIVWAVLSDEIRRHPMFMVRAVARHIDDMAKGLDVLTLAIPRDYPGADRWARALGFEFNCSRQSDGVDTRPHMEYSRWLPAQS